LVIVVGGQSVTSAGPGPSGEPAAKVAYTPERLREVIEESFPPDSLTLEYVGAASEEGPDAGTPAELIAVIAKHAPLRESDEDVSKKRLPLNRDFKERRTRVEAARGGSIERVVILKLDHLGDFIMGLPALRKARELFKDAHLTLVVGSWNEGLARDAAVADELVVFDAFPRNSSTDDVDLGSKTKSFARALAGKFDLAIDLRTDPDTRFFLEHVDADVRAGLGTHAQFPFLDIFLPIDRTRHDWETAREDDFDHWPFNCQPFCKRSKYRIHCAADDVTSRLGAVIWGPYSDLRPGNYFFEPFLEFDEPHDGMLIMDVALNYERHLARAVTADSDLRLEFKVDQPRSKFEFRIFEPEGCRPLGFSFYGGRLVREGAESVLHQSEYLFLLMELVSMRLQRQGFLRELAGSA
jgi:hypothetical protein